ncbi:MAG: NTP transferase domain-containing protein, partial [Thermoplasmata archaeon]
VLAAGLSQRFGDLKQLIDVGGWSLLEATLDCLRRSSVQDIILVLGHRADEILQRVKIESIRVVINRHFRRGMSTSIKEGLKALRGNEDAVLMVLGDQPLLRPETIDRILEVYGETRARAVVPAYNGQWGNPVLLDLSLRGRMEAIEGDRGCRELVRELPDTLVVDVDDPGVLVDVDTEEDLAKAKEMAGPTAGRRADG